MGYRCISKGVSPCPSDSPTIQEKVTRVIRFNDLPDVTPREVQSFMRLGRNATYTLLQNGTLRSVRLGQKYLIPRDAVVELLYGSAKAPKPEPKALDESEVTRLLETARIPSSRSSKRSCLSAEPWFAPAVAFSIYTGARRGEVLAVKSSDVNLEAKSVTIRRSLAETKTAGRFFKEPKNGKARTIAIPAPLVSILEQHRKRRTRNARLLLGATRTTTLSSHDLTARSHNLGTTLRRSRT